MKPLRASLVLDCTPEEFAAACGPAGRTLDVLVVDLALPRGVDVDDHPRTVLLANARQRTQHEYEEGSAAGAPLRLYLEARQEVQVDGK